MDKSGSTIDQVKDGVGTVTARTGGEKDICMDMDRKQALAKILFWGAAGLLVLTGWFVSPSSAILFLPGSSENGEVTPIREVDLVSIYPPSKDVAPGARGRAMSHLAFSTALLGLWWGIIVFVAADRRHFFGEELLKPKTQQLAFVFAALVTAIVVFLILDITDVFGYAACKLQPKCDMTAAEAIAFRPEHGTGAAPRPGA